MASKEAVLGRVQDLVSDLLWYDRKEDEELPRDAIEQMVKRGELTVEEMVSAFEEALREGVR